MKNIVSVVVLVILSFIGGYYLSYFTVQEHLQEMREINKSVKNGIKEVYLKGEVDKLIENVHVERKVLNSLIYLEESGKPI
jgi:uncharacterized protein YneF (UPF0154 family)